MFLLLTMPYPTILLLARIKVVRQSLGQNICCMRANRPVCRQQPAIQQPRLNIKPTTTIFQIDPVFVCKISHFSHLKCIIVNMYPLYIFPANYWWRGTKINIFYGSYVHVFLVQLCFRLQDTYIRPKQFHTTPTSPLVPCLPTSYHFARVQSKLKYRMLGHIVEKLSLMYTYAIEY